MAINLRTAYLSQQGVSRVLNEDCVQIRNVASERYAILCLCDGIGGLDNGEIASQICTNIMSKRILSNPIETLTRRTINANSKLSSRKKRCGSTLSAVVIDKKQCEYYALSIGDSRIYMIRNSIATRLSKDDTIVGLNSSYRGLLTNAVGIKDKMVIHSVISGALENGDSLLLMSDGAYSKLNDNNLHEIFILNKPEEYLIVLAEQAVRRKSQDDISFAICTVSKESK